MYKELMTSDLLNLKETIAAVAFEGCTYPWEVLSKIKDEILQIGTTLSEEEYDNREEDIWIAKSARWLLLHLLMAGYY